jgi:hypothetical protein
MSDLPSPVPASTIDRDAAERDYRQARERLAEMDLVGAAEWLERAASNGHAAALTELAILHLHGFGREANPAHALELLLRAEHAGGTPETPYLLAQIALGGVVLPRDPQRIDAWLADSARRGYPAALRVAALLFGQRDDTVYQQAAVTCLQRATEARDPVSAALLADRLHEGRGVTRDAAQALDFANELRAMGIPVELPEPASDAIAAAAGTAIEPPWDELRVDAPRHAIQRHCESPEIATCDTLLSDEECRYLIYSGARFIERSQVVHPETGQPLEFEVRTSQDMTFVPRADEAGIRILQHRMGDMAGFALANCEPLTLLHYGIGDQYRPHRDYFNPSAPSLAMPGGQRHSTVCVYLNDVQEGGDTIFPDVGVTVRPKRGRAVMFRNLHADGSADSHSLHAGLPVIAGDKWLASCWIRVRPLREF